MSLPAAARTGPPGLAGPAPARPWRVVATLAAAEAVLLMRSLLVLTGLVVGGVVVAHWLQGGGPLWWNAAWQIGYGQVLLAAAVLAATQLAAGRARRDGMRELYISFPVSAATRTAAQLWALAGVLPASLLLLGAGVAWVQVQHPIGTPSAWVLVAGVLVVLACGAAGIALGTRFPHALAGLLGALLLFAVFTQSRRFGGDPLSLGGLPWLFPWSTPGQLGAFAAPLAGYPPGAAHAVELAGLALLAAAVALAVTAVRARHRIMLAVTGLAAAAVVCLSGAAELQPVPAQALNHLVSAAADPVAAEHCRPEGQVRYCLYPGFGAQLASVQAPVRAVLAELPVRPAQTLTVGQDMSLTLDDPPLVHGHARAQVARWNAELRTAPAGSAATPPGRPIPPAIYTTVGSWPGTGFALALRTAEWAVRLPAGDSTGLSCVPVGQAREAIAIWLAVTATHAAPGWLLAGQQLTGPGAGRQPNAIVENASVLLWMAPGDGDIYPAGPQPTAGGFLLAQAMSRLPDSSVRRVLAAGWPAWLNPRTPDSRLAAALGIPLPRAASVFVPIGPPGTGPAVLPQQNPACTA